MQYSNLNEEVLKSMGLLAEQAGEFMQTDLVSNGKSATGNLVNNIKSVFVSQQDNGSVEYIITMPGYAEFVDKGRRPGDRPPPVKAIKDWIQQRSITVPGFTQPQLAYAIARSIGKKGIKPTPFIEAGVIETLNKNMQMVTDSAAKGITYDMADVLEDILPNANVTVS